tara:strand:+ start:595 stop:1107 length:513 start_codon:yes stop_codon:yes gene_type:complete
MTVHVQHWFHPDKPEIKADALMLLFGSVVALAGAYIYAFAIEFMPFVYLNPAFCAFFGIGIAHGIASAGRIAKAHSPTMQFAVGSFCGILGWYASWALGIGYITDTMSFAPTYVAQQAIFLSHAGNWSLFGYVPTGNALYFFWWFEALLIISISAFVPHALLNRKSDNIK